MRIYLTAFFAFLWLIISMDTVFAWLLPDNLLNATKFVLFVLCFVSSSGLKITKYRIQTIFFVALLASVFFYKGWSGPFFWVFLPFSFFLLLPKECIFKVYHLFKYFFIFYAIGSAILVILEYAGLLDRLPYFVLPSKTVVQEIFLTFNKIYGVFVVPFGDNVEGIRACGPFTEGGHFSIFLGLIYITECIVFKTRHISIIVAGFLTLSFNFVFAFCLAELYVLAQKNKISKIVAYVFYAFVILLVLLIFIPDTYMENLQYVVFERSLNRVIDNFGSDGFLSALDTRTNSQGRLLYDQFQNADFEQQLFGVPFSVTNNEMAVLSDFRNTLVTRGYIGLIAHILIIISLIKGKSISRSFVNREYKWLKISLVLMIILIFIHRAWMLDSMALYLILFIIMEVEKNHSFQIIKDGLRLDSYENNAIKISL